MPSVIAIVPIQSILEYALRVSTPPIPIPRRIGLTPLVPLLIESSPAMMNARTLSPHTIHHPKQRPNGDKKALARLALWLWILSSLFGGMAAQAFEMPAMGTLEVAFSPNEGSEELVIKAIDSSRREIRGLAYSFTNAPITEALIRAKKRGIQISWVVDKKSSTSEDHSGKARAALSALVNAGCEVRLIDRFPIHHDKVMIIDQQTVELGSFNFSSAAAHKNSENVLVNWNNPKLAQVYLGHFDRNYRLSQPFQAQY